MHTKEIKQFLELIHPLPAYKILEVFLEESDITLSLEKHLQSSEGTLNSIKYGESALALDKPFRALPREYDVVIFYNILLSHQHSQRLLKIAYTTLANAANIIIIEDKNSDESKIFSLLESCDFRAANSIDIFEGKNVVVAKKMHMWGNGL